LKSHEFDRFVQHHPKGDAAKLTSEHAKQGTPKGTQPGDSPFVIDPCAYSTHGSI